MCPSPALGPSLQPAFQRRLTLTRVTPRQEAFHTDVLVNLERLELLDGQTRLMECAPQSAYRYLTVVWHNRGIDSRLCPFDEFDEAALLAHHRESCGSELAPDLSEGQGPKRHRFPLRSGAASGL